MRDEDGMTDRPTTARVGRARRWAGALLLGVILAVLAAVGVGVFIRASSTVPARIAREPVELHPRGDFIHPAGFLMPEKSGPFERTEVLQYDAARRNLSAGYAALLGSENRLPVVVTLYVYPASPGDSLDKHFEHVLKDVREAHGGARPEFRKHILLSPRNYDGRYAVFGYKEPWGRLKDDVHLRSYLVLYRWDDWWVKWRVTTPGPVDPERMRAIVALTETLLPPQDEPSPNEEPSESELGPERLTLHEEEETWDSASAPTAS